jgi:hypothetical protein
MTEPGSTPNFVRQALSSPVISYGKHGFSNLRKSAGRLASTSKHSIWPSQPCTTTDIEDQISFTAISEHSPSIQTAEKPLFSVVRLSVNRLASTSRRWRRPGQTQEETSNDDPACNVNSQRDTPKEESKFSKIRHNVKEVSSTWKARTLQIVVTERRHVEQQTLIHNAVQGSSYEQEMAFEDGNFVTAILPSPSEDYDISNSALPVRRVGLREQIIENIRSVNNAVDVFKPIIPIRNKSRRLQADRAVVQSSTCGTISEEVVSARTQYRPASDERLNTQRTFGSQRQSQDSSAPSLNDSGYGTIEPYVSPRSTWSSMASWVTAQDHAAIEFATTVTNKQVTNEVGHDTLYQSPSAASSFYSDSDSLQRSSMDLTSTLIEELKPRERRDCATVCTASPTPSRTILSSCDPSLSSLTLAPELKDDTRDEKQFTPFKQPSSQEEQDRGKESRKSLIPAAVVLFREALKTFDPDTSACEEPKRIFTTQNGTSSARHEWKRGVHKDSELANLFDTGSPRRISIVRRVVEENRVSSTTTGGRDILDMYTADNEYAKVKLQVIHQAIEDSNTPTAN